MDSNYKLFWTKEALQNLDETILYLQSRWTDREVDLFKKKLSHLLSLIELNPKLFPTSTLLSEVRKSVLTKQTSIFYKVDNQKIYILYLFNTYQNTTKLK
jgi:plasmid stabilization system protein ParE